MNDNFYILITGGRSFHDYEELKNKCNELLINKRNKNITVVTGTSMGTDELARNYARDNNFDLKIYKTEWEKHGRRAAYVRTRDMQNFIKNQTDSGEIIFWNGHTKGTEYHIKLAKENNVPLRLYHYNNEPRESSVNQ